MDILKDLWGFLRERKKWWLLPVIFMLLLIGLIILSGSSAVAPFIYTLFQVLPMDRLETAKTINVLSLAFMAAYFLFRMEWLLWPAFLLSIGNILETRLTAAIARYWMQLAAILGKINTRICLSIIFYAVLTPVALLYRLFNRELADHFRRDSRASYFEKMNKSYVKSDFEKLW